MFYKGFPGSTEVKNLPANAKDARVESLRQEDPLEEETATHSSTLAWKIPWIEELGALQSMKSQESDVTKYTNNNYLTSIISYF